MQADDYIETIHGRKLFIDRPVFDAREIAYSQAMLCRFTGHCKRFYSVGEHSMLVERIMIWIAVGDPFEGLMHDGTESVLADVNSPNKRRLADYKALEHHYDRHLRAQFALPLEMTAACKHADWVALAIEARKLLPTRGEDWYIPDDARRDATIFLRRFPDAVAKRWPSFALARRRWLNRFKYYRGDIV